MKSPQIMLVAIAKFALGFLTANCQIIVSMSTSFSFCCVFVGLFELMLKQLHIISSRPLGPTQAKPLAL